jgi:chemotaxis protein MotB
MAKGHKSGKKHHHAEHEHEEHVNHEAWVIPYADMLTLLMALFLVLFAIGRVDTEKFKKLADSLHQSIAGGPSNKPSDVVKVEPTPMIGNGVLLFSDLMSKLQAAADRQEAKEWRTEQQQHTAQVQATVDDLRRLQTSLQNSATQNGFGDKLTFTLEGRGLVVAISTDQVLFQPGNADLELPGKRLLDVVLGELRTTTYRLKVEGHTDSRPIATSKFPSNWELSTARATRVTQYLIDNGFEPGRLEASGFADTRPVAPGDSPSDWARNRRVDVVVLTDITLPATATGSTN